MATLKYLWRNRAKFGYNDKRTYLAWGKRLLTIKEVISRNSRRNLLIGKGATVAETAEIGEVNINGNKDNLKIGEFSFIGKVEIALHDMVSIGEHVCINDGVILLTASHNLQDPQWQHKKAPIFINDYAWICTNAIILPGVKIGKGAVVGAGAVVSKDVGDFEIVAGNPAKPISKLRVSNLSYNPCEFLAANSAWIKG